jgi:hypothetical protein
MSFFRWLFGCNCADVKSLSAIATPLKLREYEYKVCLAFVQAQETVDGAGMVIGSIGEINEAIAGGWEPYSSSPMSSGYDGLSAALIFLRRLKPAVEAVS